MLLQTRALKHLLLNPKALSHINDARLPSISWVPRLGEYQMLVAESVNCNPMISLSYSWTKAPSKEHLFKKPRECSSTCHIVILGIRAICHSHDSPDYANLSHVYNHLLGGFINN